METISIENGELCAEIKVHGAELKSLMRKSDGQELMWEADSNYWGKTSPILFPFIGKLEGENYRYGGQTYPAEKHGFARDMDFAVAEKEDSRVVFAIESNDTTLEKYPFSFRLEMEYRLEGAALQAQYRVTNKGENPMYFSLGGHPAFACPLLVNGKRAGKRTDGSTIHLYGENHKPLATDSLQATEINVHKGLLTGEQYEVAMKQGVIPIVDHIFDKDALCFAGQGVREVGIADAAGREYIRMEADCPVWGIWSMPMSDASYVCIEPWWGICDTEGYEGTLEERPYTNQVAKGETWQHGFTLYI